MLAYHNNQAIKAKYLKRVRKHREADQLVHGIGWESGKGCAVGCTFNKYDHARGPVEIGVPEQLMHLEDAIFEGLKNGEAQDWPTQFLDAIPVGADLSLVWARFAHWLLVDEVRGVILCATTDETRKAVQGVADLYAREIAGDKPSVEEWSSSAWAASAARDARAARAASAASSAWAAWAASAARDASAARAARAASAASSAWAASAARAARAASAASSAWAASAARDAIHWRACRDKLLELLRAQALGGSESAT